MQPLPGAIMGFGKDGHSGPPFRFAHFETGIRFKNEYSDSGTVVGVRHTRDATAGGFGHSYSF
ncbi:MAG TPA: hypothetical protein DCZ08_09360 [Anaerolineaceae bacterium]|nr:hypothetical protein [Anaerolineaceae bacterium]